MTRKSRTALVRVPAHEDGPEPALEACSAQRHAPGAENQQERLPGEGEAAFRRYLRWLTSNVDGGPRSITRVAAEDGVDESSVRQMARRWNWVGRASQLDRAAVERELSTGLEVQRRGVVAQIAVAEKLTRIIERIVDELEQRDLDGDKALDALAPALDAVKVLQRAQAALRTALGLPTSTTRSEVAVAVFDAGKKSSHDIWRFATDDELRWLGDYEKLTKELHERAARGGVSGAEEARVSGCDRG
jgi:hypothetical protein